MTKTDPKTDAQTTDDEEYAPYGYGPDGAPLDPANRMRVVPSMMTEDDFWNLVADIGWGTKTTDFRAVKIKLMKRGLDACKAIEARYYEVESRLYKAAEAAGHDYCNDGWGDTVSHVIGLGKAEFERNVANPDLLVERQDKGDYEEKFSYGLPGEMDFDQYDRAKLDARRAEFAKDYTNSKGRFPEADEMIDEMVAILTGDFMAQADRLKVLATEIKDTCQALLARQMPHNACYVTDGGDVLMNEWCVRNLISDTKNAKAALAA